jgi:secreted trypsin-like serine protease
MRWALPFLLVACTLGCGQTDPEVAEGRAAIIGGAPDPGDSPVVMLVSYPADHSTFDTCTASLISPTVLLTAAHCVDPQTHAGHGFGIFTGPDASAYTTANTLIPQLSAIAEAHIHPDYDPKPPFKADIAVAILEQPLERVPLVFNRDALDVNIVEQPARLIGYGQTKYKTYNAIRHAVDTVVADLPGDDTVTVGDLQHRSCIGDSGGPALTMMNDEMRIIGVDSYTDLQGCLEPAHYRRTDLYTAFLDEFVPLEPPPDPDNQQPKPQDPGCQMSSGQTRPSYVWSLVLALAILGRKRRSHVLVRG